MVKGCFILDGPAGGFDKLAAEAKAEAAFLDLLSAYTAQGRDVSDSPGANYAPTEFERQGRDPQTKAALKAAMSGSFSPAKSASTRSGRHQGPASGLPLSRRRSASFDLPTPFQRPY